MNNNNNIYNIYNIYKNKNFYPIWLMRQAGRYLPEYLDIRKSKKNFLELCYDPLLTKEITLQPIKRFNFDAAIIFSDILVILDALGCKVTFEKNHGPKIQTNIDEFIDYNKTNLEEKITNKLDYVYKAIKLVRNDLDENKSLIGFSGAFWTLFAYLIEEQGSKNFCKAKQFFYNNPKKYDKIKNILCSAITVHLKNQVNAGCDTIQIFDSWVGVLTPYQINPLVIEPTRDILAKLKNINSNIICFPRGIGYAYNEYAKLDFDILALDYNFPIEKAAEIYNKYGKAIQGNLDPSILLVDDIKIIEEEVGRIIKYTKDVPTIFNLGHGILPQTPISNVQELIRIVKDNYMEN